MEKFIKITAIAAPLPIQNVDTDMIIPKQFLKTIKRTGLSEGLFFEMRFDADGNKIDDFILHREPFTKAGILIGSDNFGCGSSREHAPWALLDFGIRTIIAPSFADIFYNNCFKNGILPIILPQNEIDKLMEVAANAQEITIDLESQKVSTENISINFEIDAFRKKCLMEGLDDISLTEQKSAKISAFESQDKQDAPWLHIAA